MRGEQLFELACRQHDSGRFQQAIDLLTQILGEDPNLAAPHGLLASCLLAQNRVVAAEYESGIALGLDPNSPFLHEVRARVLIALQKFDEATESINASLRLDPHSPSSYVLKSAIDMHFERNDDALAALDRALEVAPADEEVIVARGEFFNCTGDHQRAMQHAREALAINAGSEPANVLMGKTQLALGDVAEAEYHARFAMTQNPESESALLLFANIKMRRNWFVGLWWRFNNWVATLGNAKSVLVLIGGYLAFNLLSVVADDLGYPTTAATLSYLWLALVLYSWIGIPIYRQALSRELEKFSFNKDF